MVLNYSLITSIRIYRTIRMYKLALKLSFFLSTIEGSYFISDSTQNTRGRYNFSYILFLEDTEKAYLHRDFGESSKGLRSFEQSVFRGRWIRHGRYPFPFAQFVFRANKNSHAIYTEEAYDDRSYYADNVSGMVESLRHRENPGTQTALQQVKHSFRIAEKLHREETRYFPLLIIDNCIK